MRSFLQLPLLSLSLLGAVASEELPSPTQQHEDTKSTTSQGNANQAFYELINVLPEESLHVALNGLSHFRAGIFESDRHGVERVHRDDPPLATKLIIAAVEELKKRQTPSNGTTPGSTSPTTSSQRPTSAVIVPVPIPTTDSSGRSTTVSSSVLSDPTASVAVTTTRTNSQGQTEVATETRPAVIMSTTDSAGRSFETTSAVDFVPTSGEVLTRTDASGSTFVTTYTPDGVFVSSVTLITTTGEDGSPSTITSYTSVDPMQTQVSNPSGASNQPGLQNGAAKRRYGIDAALVGSALGGALAFFL